MSVPKYTCIFFVIMATSAPAMAFNVPDKSPRETILESLDPAKTYSGVNSSGVSCAVSVESKDNILVVSVSPLIADRADLAMFIIIMGQPILHRQSAPGNDHFVDVSQRLTATLKITVSSNGQQYIRIRNKRSQVADCYHSR